MSMLNGVEIIPLENVAGRQRYDAFFEASPNAFIQQSSYWAEAVAPLGGDKVFFALLTRNGEAAAGLPLYLFEHADGNVLTSVPQPGPMGGIFYSEQIPSGELRGIYQELLRSAVAFAREKNCLTISFITNPFVPDIDLYREFLEPSFVFKNFTQSIPLLEIVKDGKISLKDYNRRSNLSRNLKKAHAASFVVTNSVENSSRLNDWYPIHAARHQEIGATPLRLDLFQGILNCLAPRGKAHLQLVTHGNDIASGCIYVYHKKVLDVFLLSMNTQFLDAAPNFLSTENAILWAAERGIEQFNWQSAPTRSGGVYRFKEQWGSTDLTYYYVSKVLCPIERIQSLGTDKIRKNYPFRFVVPYAAFSEGFDKVEFQK